MKKIAFLILLLLPAFKSFSQTFIGELFYVSGNLKGAGTEADPVLLLPGYTEITSTSSPVTLTNTETDNLINQGGTRAAFTFKLPATPFDKQVCSLTFINAVTVLTIDGNGTTIIGTLPTTAAAGTRVSFQYYQPVTAWVRIL